MNSLPNDTSSMFTRSDGLVVSTLTTLLRPAVDAQNGNTETRSHAGSQTLNNTTVVMSMNHPKGICFDSSGHLLVADFGHSVIRRVSLKEGVPEIWCGQLNVPLPRQIVDGVRSDARFNGPLGITHDPLTQTTYVSDFSAHVIRSISPAGHVRTICGAPQQQGYRDGVGGEARFKFPRGLGCDPLRKLLFVCDTENQVVRRVNMVTRAVSTLCGFPGLRGFDDGRGIAARLSAPAWATADWSGYIYISDNDNNLVRRVSPQGEVVTWGGTPAEEGFADGPANQSKFFNPRGTVVDLNGTVVLADYGNQCLRRIAEHQVSTFAGKPGAPGLRNGSRAEATFSTPVSIAMHPTTGDLYMVDEENHNVRRLSNTGLVPWSWHGVRHATRLLRLARLLSVAAIAPNGCIMANSLRAAVLLAVLDVSRGDFLTSPQLATLLDFASDRRTLGAIDRNRFLVMTLSSGYKNATVAHTISQQLQMIRQSSTSSTTSNNSNNSNNINGGGSGGATSTVASLETSPNHSPKSTETIHDNNSPTHNNNTLMNKIGAVVNDDDMQGITASATANNRKRKFNQA